jgi:hypothetical protein
MRPLAHAIQERKKKKVSSPALFLMLTLLVLVFVARHSFPLPGLLAQLGQYCFCACASVSISGRPR